MFSEDTSVLGVTTNLKQVHVDKEKPLTKGN